MVLRLTVRCSEFQERAVRIVYLAVPAGGRVQELELPIYRISGVRFGREAHCGWVILGVDRSRAGRVRSCIVLVRREIDQEIVHEIWRAAEPQPP